MNKSVELQSRILKIDPNATGTVFVTEVNRVITVKCELSSTITEEIIKEIAKELYPKAMIAYDIKINKGLTVLTTEGSVASKTEKVLDEVDVLYYGFMNASQIKKNDKYKFINNEKFLAMKNCVSVLDFIAPIVLDSNLQVIDGNFRVDLALNNDITQVPVIVLNVCDERADFLRLALNRSSEFQRWKYSDVDEYADSVPQAQPLLEPLGIFGKKVLPVSFFANTVINYTLDEYNDQQKLYRQEEGIAAWAAAQRERIQREEEQRLAKIKRKKSKVGVSLFDLKPKEDDFVETYDIHEEIKEHEVKMRQIASDMTDTYDEHRKPLMDRWQGTRRTSTEKTRDNREAAMKNEE